MMEDDFFTPYTPTTEELIEDLRFLRLEARELARSGHPGARAEGKRAVKQITEDLRELTKSAEQ